MPNVCFTGAPNRYLPTTALKIIPAALFDSVLNKPRRGPRSLARPKACPQPCAQLDWALTEGHVPHDVFIVSHKRAIRRDEGHLVEHEHMFSF